MPARQLHDTTHSPAALYQLNNPSARGEDTSGNSRTLSVSNVLVAPGWVGTSVAYSNIPAGSLENNQSDSYWANSSALSVYGMVNFSNRTSVATVVAISATDGTFQYWALELGVTNTADITYTHHNSGGVLRQAQSGYATVIPQVWCHVGFTRDSAGTGIKLYLDGIEKFSTTLADAPGTHTPASSRFTLSSSSVPIYTWSSIKVVNAELTAAQMKAEHARMFGGV